ncbi:Uu.00g093590.m01.CDS01 [Anthostomella pinea]|uniref:Uu.00g093590.m01.CDS01 n=1 Tax=Anthostomella pinea TaxID=933095 RepID=A0AAI8VNK1_9PEZI|nr:Uu.00g093590.m01.CDS01 [Anthostomella pinea]
MPFPFRYICDLLQDLEDDIRKAKSYPTSGKAIIARWFDQHRLQLHAPGNDVCAILSTLLPERRTDRVYFIQAPRLQSIVGQALCLGFSRVAELRRYQTPGLGIDLGDCVERILERTPNSTSGRDDLTVEDIDAVLEEIAAACRFSSPKIQSRRTIRDTNYANEALGELYRRLGAQEAKWFTRLVLKSYEPVVLDQYTVFRSYHYLLPRMLKVRDDLTITTAFLRHAEQSPGDQVRIASILKPQLGTKVGRQTWIKGRSIKHCLDMGRRRVISCEQKLDGEYCQIHIDRSKGYQCIHIFSKSGKDSTVDRSGLHGAIRGSLKLDEQDCPVKKGCILEGELLVYSNKDHKILPFHKIRKHVSRSGSFIGTNHDSQPHEYEHLMIVYYDLLMIDDESLLGLRHSERRRRLTRLITCRTGHAAIVQHQDVSLARRSAASQLRKAFADCIVNRGEGLVLKPDEPYFDFGASSQPYASCIFKLKKEYVQGWGDVGDFAVVGASYDSVKAKTYNLPNLKWTHFFIGCLDNQARPTAGIRKPRFRVVNMVELNATMLKTVTQCSPLSVPFDGNTAFDLDLSGLGTNKPPTVLFPEPMVFDVRCFSFDKASNTNFWSMRFPMVSKVHFDRSWKDTISFDEMQEAAVTATEVPEQEDSQEMREWVTALEKADPWGIAVDAISQTSSLSEPIVSQTVVEQQHEYVSTLDAILEASENPLHSRAQGREAGVPEFMESITRAGPKRKDGEREWVEVYDWRLLEALTDTESRKGAPGNFNPWRKYRLGLA